MKVDVQALDADFYVFSGHKVFGPTGIGALYGKSEILEAMPPWQGGGNMIADVTFDKTVFNPAPFKFEAGTGNIADAVGLGAALDYVERIGMAAAASMMQPATAAGASGAADVGPQLPAQPGEAGLGDEDFVDYGNSGYDVGHYDINIRYTPGEDNIEGVTTITLTPNIHLSRFNLDFVLAVSDVTVDGVKAMFAKEGHHELVITPAASLPAGRAVDVVVKYADVPGKVRVTNVQLGGWWPTRDGVIAAGAPESAWWWFPNNDHPSDKATHAVTVTVPDNLVAISNGVQAMLPAAAEPGFKTWSWVSMKPQQSNVTLLAIGDFEVTQSTTASGLPVTLAYSKRSNSANARASLDKTVEIVAWEETVFGSVSE